MHTLLHISNISLASTWRPSGPLEFISNTDKYVLNHAGERFNLQLECKALDNPLAAPHCCYGTHFTAIQCNTNTAHCAWCASERAWNDGSKNTGKLLLSKLLSKSFLPIMIKYHVN